MARKVGQIIARGDRRWLIRVYVGRDREAIKRNYHNRTIHGPMREAQAYLTRNLRERDLGRDLADAKITLNEYLDRWLEAAVKPRVREKTCQDYEGMLRRYVRPNLGERVLAAMRPLDLQTLSADDRTLSVCANGPVHACGAEVCNAAGCAVATSTRKSSRWPPGAAATKRRNPGANVGAGEDFPADSPSCTL